ncbi:tyrosine-type recombinase/integrase [Paenibacillus silvisoli]|uniref:tyrosine-type recombinase/integrase n=1 Tax=Paenibacillus silvisoli TaxID=3110539 RepID=UPI002804F3F3|nr:tyrosine-type recombinase/integrase [Paenibacillus silvisoli]
MRGHVAAKGNKYYIVVDIKDETTGKRKRKWLTGSDGKGFDRKRDAEREMPLILTKLNDGTFKETSTDSFDILMSKWLEDKKSAVRPGTWKSYAWLVNTHIIPHLGKVKAARLEPQQLHTLYHKTLKGVISISSIKKLHVLILDALNRAVTWGDLPRNVASTVELPKGTKTKFEVWNEEQLGRFLDAAANDQFFIVYELAASTGMRQSEIMALRWVDVDLEGKKIAVRQAYTKAERGHDFDDTKSAASERSVSLFPDTVAHLKRHREVQVARKRENGESYKDSGLVVQTMIGTPVNPRNMMRNWYALHERIQKEQEEAANRGKAIVPLPRIRFHDLRHTHATILLKKGAHPKIVQERLGHSSITVTLDTYSHVLPNMQESVLEGIGMSITGRQETIANKKAPL